MDTSEIKNLVVIESEVSRSCSVCHQRHLGGTGAMFEDSVSHVLNEHDYALLHVGPQSFLDGDGNLFHGVIAVCGSHKSLPPQSAGDEPWEQHRK